MRKVHIINTNKSHNPECEKDMLIHKKCSAYYGKWKHLINTIQMNDLVFLYSNQKGIIARGTASGILEIADYEGHEDEEYYMELDRFQILKNPLPASEICEVTEIDVVFGTTLFTFKNYETGLKLWQYITKNCLI